MDKTQEHFDEALEENAHVFKHLDPDGNGNSCNIGKCMRIEDLSQQSSIFFHQSSCL